VFRYALWIAAATTLIATIVMIMFPGMVTWIPSLSG
jgi:hypothetical protein